MKKTNKQIFVFGRDLDKKAFTLIELLAVIVILAIIALIATPIILGIINDAKKESKKRSIDNYGQSIEQAIIRYEMKTGKTPYGYYSSDENGKVLSLDNREILKINYDGSSVKCNIIKISKKGQVYLNKCNVANENIEYQYKNDPSICIPVTNETATRRDKNDNNSDTVGNIPQKGQYSKGDEYICEVAPGIKYHFYLLSANSNETLITDFENNEQNNTSYNLIMSHNVDKNGKYYENAIGNYVNWITKEDFNNYGGEDWDSNNKSSKGPITALNFIEQATKDWNNLSDENGNYPIIISGWNKYENNQSDQSSGFVYFEKNGIRFSYSLYARLPYYSEIYSLEPPGTEVNPRKPIPYLYDYMRNDQYCNKPFNIVSNLSTYWLLDSFKGAACSYTCSGGLTSSGVADALTGVKSGIRPVITVSSFDLNNQ